MRTLLLVTFIILGNYIFGSEHTTYEGCANDQEWSKIRDSVIYSKNMLKNWEEELSKHPDIDKTPHKKGSYHRRNPVQVALSVVRCMKKKVTNMKYICGSKKYLCKKENMYGWTPFIFTKNIHLCSGFWGHDIVEDAGQILHEVSHKCGTLDLKYHSLYDSDIPKKRYGVFSWANNADTYRIWTHHGFIIP